MILLRWLDLVGSWPKVVSSHAICCCRFVLVPVLLVRASGAVVFYTNGMMAMGPTVVSHISRVLENTGAAAAVVGGACLLAAAGLVGGSVCY